MLWAFQVVWIFGPLIYPTSWKGLCKPWAFGANIDHLVSCHVQWTFPPLYLSHGPWQPTKILPSSEQKLSLSAVVRDSLSVWKCKLILKSFWGSVQALVFSAQSRRFVLQNQKNWSWKFRQSKHCIIRHNCIQYRYPIKTCIDISWIIPIPMQAQKNTISNLHTSLRRLCLRSALASADSAAAVWCMSGRKMHGWMEHLQKSVKYIIRWHWWTAQFNQEHLSLIYRSNVCDCTTLLQNDAECIGISGLPRSETQLEVVACQLIWPPQHMLFPSWGCIKVAQTKAKWVPFLAGSAGIWFESWRCDEGKILHENKLKTSSKQFEIYFRGVLSSHLLNVRVHHGHWIRCCQVGSRKSSVQWSACGLKDIAFSETSLRVKLWRAGYVAPT